MRNAGNKKLLALLVTLALLAMGLFAMGSTFAGQVNRNDTPEQKLSDTQDFRITVDYYADGSYSKPLLVGSPVFTRDVLWCPNKTEIVYLKIASNEAFPVESTLSMEVGNSSLNDVMEYVILPGLTPTSDKLPQSWQDLKDAAVDLTAGSQPIFTNLALNDDTPVFYAVALHMNENASSDYQNKALNLTFKLRTDANYEPGATPAK